MNKLREISIETENTKCTVKSIKHVEEFVNQSFLKAKPIFKAEKAGMEAQTEMQILDLEIFKFYSSFLSSNDDANDKQSD